MDKKILRKPGVAKRRPIAGTKPGGDPGGSGGAAGISFIDNGGPVINGARVELIFWGSAWKNPDNSPKAIEVAQAVIKILAGPFTMKLTQYRVYAKVILTGSNIFADTEPPLSFTEADVQGVIDKMITAGIIPETHDRYPYLYMVIMPPGATYATNKEFLGAHWFLDRAADHVRLHYGWATNNGDLDYITGIFSHELVESLTDPEVNAIRRDSPTCQVDDTCEIADVCYTWYSQQNVLVQRYWSQQDHDCVESNGPPRKLSGDPFSASDEWDTVHFLYGDADGRVCDLYYQWIGGWSFVNLTELVAGAPKINGSPVAINDYWHTFHVFFRDEHDHITDLFYQDAAGWQNVTLNVTVGAPDANGIPATCIDMWNTLHLVYRDKNNKITDIFYRKDQDWQQSQLGAAINPPDAHGNPTPFMDKWGTFHVFYRDKNNRVCDIFYRDGADWQLSQLGQVVGAPDAQGDLSVALDDWDTLHVLYRNSNNKISDIFYQDGRGWQQAELSTPVGAPDAAGDPFGFMDNFGSMHVLYRDKHNRISDIFYRADPGWQLSTLNIGLFETPLGITAPLAGGRPFACLDVFSVTHVLYRDENDRLADLFYSPEDGWRYETNFA